MNTVEKLFRPKHKVVPPPRTEVDDLELNLLYEQRKQFLREVDPMIDHYHQLLEYRDLVVARLLELVQNITVEPINENQSDSLDQTHRLHQRYQSILDECLNRVSYQEKELKRLSERIIIVSQQITAGLEHRRRIESLLLIHLPHHQFNPTGLINHSDPNGVKLVYRCSGIFIDYQELNTGFFEWQGSDPPLQRILMFIHIMREGEIVHHSESTFKRS